MRASFVLSEIGIGLRRNLTMTPAEERVFLAVRTQALALEHASQIEFETGSDGS